MSRSLFEDEAAAAGTKIPSTTTPEPAPHEDDLASLIMLDDDCATRLLPPGAMTSSDTLDTLVGPASQEPSAAVLQLLSVGATSIPSESWQAAAAVLTTGLDLKALLPDGKLTALTLRQQSLRQCELSFTNWSHVEAVGCDFRQSVFFGVSFTDVSFQNCTFDGAVLKGMRLRGSIMFSRCSFRRCVMGLVGRCAGQAVQITFAECDLDLSCWADSEGMNVPSFFHRCSNVETAHQFPLRASTA